MKVENIEADYIGALFKSDKMKFLPDYRKQEIMGDLLKARFSREKNALDLNEPEPKKPDVTFEPIQANGSFSVLFDEGIAGLDFLQNLEVEVKAKGTISIYWADEKDPKSEYGFSSED